MKKTISIDVDESLIKAIEKRAKSNHLSVREQIKDMVVRSMAGWGKKTTPTSDHQVSKMVKIFSRKKPGPKAKPKKKKKK